MTNPPLPRGKLTEIDVTAIKKLLWEGALQSTIARQYHVTQPTISYILRGSQWAWVPWPDGTEGPMLLEHKLSLTNGKAKDENHASTEAVMAAEIIEQKAAQKEEEEDQKLLRTLTRPRKEKNKTKSKSQK